MKKGNKKRFPRYGLKLSLANVNWQDVERIFFKDRERIVYRLDKYEDNTPTANEILKLLAGGAVIGLSLLFPTLPMAIAPFLVDGQRYQRWKLNHTVKRLKKQKLVEIFEENGSTLVKITEKGRVRALRYKIDEMTIKRPKEWDKKWRLVSFDIPEESRIMREIFRDHLKSMGFYMLQKSVWIHPYPCFNEIEFLRQVYNVGINVTYIVAEKIEGSANLAQSFHLNHGS